MVSRLELQREEEWDAEAKRGMALSLDQIPQELIAIYLNGMRLHTMYIGEVLNCWIRK